MIDVKGRSFISLMKDPSSLLQHVRHYIEVDEDEARYFVSLFTTRVLRRRQLLVETGKIFPYDCFVQQGCLREHFTGADGKQHVVQFITEGGWTGDVQSFLRAVPAIVSVEAVEDCILWQIDAPSLEHLFKKHPKFERFYRIAFQETYILFQQRVISSLSQSVEQRYVAFIKEQPDLVRRIPQHQIAAYLGISPEFLSKIRRKIARQRT